MLAKRIGYIAFIALCFAPFGYPLLAQTKSGPIMCPDRAKGDSSNACANTRFVINNGGGGGGGSPGGVNAQVQFNNSGAFGGANVNYNTGTQYFGIGVVPSRKFEVNAGTDITIGKFSNSGSSTNGGAFIVSAFDSQGIFTGGMDFVGANWIARASGASSIQFQAGEATVTCNLGLGVGSSFTPTSCLQVRDRGTNVRGSLAINLDVTSGTDISGTLQTAMSTFKEIRIPCGTYLISVGHLDFAFNNQTISGSGSCTILQNNLNDSSYRGMFKIKGGDSPLIKDMVIDMNSIGSSAFCIDVENTSRAVVQNIQCKNSLNGGITFAQDADTGLGSSPWGRIEGVYFENISNVVGTNSHSIEISDSPNVVITNVTMNNVDNGINIAGSDYASITNVSIVGSGNATNYNANGFPGVRCANSNHMSVSGVSMTSTSRGVMILTCKYSTFAAITIKDTYKEPVFVGATAGGAVTQGNAFSAIIIQSGCNGGLVNGCPGGAYGVWIGQSGGGVTTNNTFSGVNLINNIGAVAQLFGLSGVAPGLHQCSNAVNMANIAFGGC